MSLPSFKIPSLSHLTQPLKTETNVKTMRWCCMRLWPIGKWMRFTASLLIHKIMRVYERHRESNSLHKQHIYYVVCLPGGRQALDHVVCWRPQLQAAIPQQRLHGTSVVQGQQHISGTTKTTTKKKILNSFQSTGQNTQNQPAGNIFIKHLWPR